MDIPQLEVQLEILNKVQEKFEVLKEDYYKSVSDEEDLTIEASLSEIDQEMQHLEGNPCSGTPTREPQTFPLDRNSEEVTVKTLGMLWGSSTDTFSYKVTMSTNSSFTKRDVLSDIARIYDPLGLLGPFITKAKIFMQQLWLLKIDWHEKLPPDIAEQWKTLIIFLPDLELIKIPRFILHNSVTSIVLCGFSDASSKAFGTVIYLQSVSISSDITSRLLCNPSKGLIRVGGRISHTKVNFNQKFSIIDNYKLQNN
ncbi:integrase catalytic domain-containing protein [Nephila pilipes]|uniref:Integrase catalytic domain-containing protein n=1 Tax=Nephila pilipes TaxID=299642 RepID=A0A8X6QCU3_NEPPI|nr:integrase catalytic domain-containing protein [Nephila pilipes]